MDSITTGVVLITLEVMVLAGIIGYILIGDTITGLEMMVHY